MDSIPRRKITCPQRFRYFEKLANSDSEVEKLGEEEDEDYTPKKSKKRKHKTKQGLPNNCHSHSQLFDASGNENDIPKCERLCPAPDLTDVENSNDDRKKHGANAYICDECGKVLRSKDTLLRHKISHSGSKPFICVICDKGFSSAVSLKEHKAKHEDKMLYECSICSKKFRQNSCYCRHLQTHSKVYPHECHICNRRFALKDYLRSHMKKHTGEKRHVCSQCKKPFAHLSDLNRHKITHTGERPYKCDVCGLCFTDSSSCRRHTKEHDTNSKSEIHVCNVCSATFSSSIQLEQHVQERHNASTELFEKQSNIDNVSIEVQVIKENDCCSVPRPALNSDIANLHSTEFAQIPTTSKPVPDTMIDCRDFLNSEDYSNGYIELGASLQAATSSDFREDLPLTPPEELHENIQETNSESISYQYYADINTLQKPSLTYTTDFQSLPSVSSQIDYFNFPDFNSQSYYSWLSHFSALCKLLPFPIESELFNKISQVHKSIADVLADPSGILSDKNNFKILRSISQDLLHVTNGHLNFVFDHLQD